MEKQNRFKVYTKKKKARKITIGIVLVLTLIFLGFKYVNTEIDNAKLQIQIAELKNNNTIIKTCEQDTTSKIKSFFNGFLENEKYSLFVKFLIFMGALYLVMIGVSAFVDITELIALGFLGIRGLFRLPKKIILKLKERKKKNESPNTL